MGPVSVRVQPGGFAHVQLCSEPVNVMDMAMWEGLSAALQQCEACESGLPLSHPVLTGHPEDLSAKECDAYRRASFYLTGFSLVILWT